MTFTKTKINGVTIIEPKFFEDNRGSFIKNFNEGLFHQEGLTTDFKENYYSTSKKNVIRGMHFQTPPKDHVKLVYVTIGKIIDVVLDIRKNSPTYGQYLATELSPKNPKAIYIPNGCAHGFLSLEDNSMVIYLQTSTYSKEHDEGVKFDSFGMDWGSEKHVLSERDLGFPTFKEYQSPF